MLQAADTAAGLLAVSGALKADMVALGMDAEKIRGAYTLASTSRASCCATGTPKSAKLGIAGLA